MSQSRRRSTRTPAIDPYLSLSKAFVVVHRTGTAQDQEALFDVEREEKEIVRLTKLIEPEYLGQSAASQLTEAHLKSAISESQQDLRNLRRPLENLETAAADWVEVTHVNQRNKDNANTPLDDLDQHARDLIEEIRLVEFRKEQLEELRESVHRSSNSNQRNHLANTPNDVHRQLCKKLSTQLAQWDSQTLRQKFAQDQSYKAFRQRIWEASGVEGIMPPLKSLLPADAGEGEGEESEESSGEELEIAGGTQNFKCPLCLGYLKQPMRSTLCNHTFCKPCFEGYLEQNRANDAPCPTAGCSRQLDRSLVTLDEGIASRIRQLRTRQQLRQGTQELFDDELPSQTQDRLFNSDGESPKPNTLPRRKSNSTQKRRRVIVDDD